MIRKTVSLLLILAFLNLVIVPGFVFAEKTNYQPYPDTSSLFEDKSDNTWLYVGGALIGLLVIYLLIPKSKSTSSPSEPSKDQSQGIENLKSDLDDRLTPTGEVVVARW